MLQLLSKGVHTNKTNKQILLARLSNLYYFSGNLAGAAAAAANTFSPYAAAYANAANMMNWNSYSLATYQGLQREGVTYGKTIFVT